MNASHPAGSDPNATVIRKAFASCRTAFIGVGLFSCLINILGMTGPLYMLQIYDRVLPSGSIPTLIGLTILMIGLYVALGLLEFIRSRLLIRIANRLDRLLQRDAFAASLAVPLQTGPEGQRIQPIRDLDQIRGFLSGSGPGAFFDLPWLPFYLALIYLLHPLLGLLATAAAALSVALTLVADRLARNPTKRATASLVSRQQDAEAARRNAEVVRAMGLVDRFSLRWSRRSQQFLRDQQSVSDAIGATGAVSRTLRMIFQSLILGVGAYLVVTGQATGGVIIASSIALNRALAPVDLAIGNWRGFISARQSYTLLSRSLETFARRRDSMMLPRPKASLDVQGLSVAAPGAQKPIIANVSFSLAAGAGLGIIGPSAAGKSTLLRALVGIWAAQRGTVRLDHASLDQWNAEILGRDIGYLPQDIELFEGTIAQNIARFQDDADPRAILAAADAAGVDSMVRRLPDGFDTQIGPNGVALSAGQRQRIGLARALYGEPFLVALDEPNSNLDADGEAALSEAVLSVRRRGGIVVVVAHRPSALAHLDQLLFMNQGVAQAFGSKAEVLAKVTRPDAAEPPPAPAPADGRTDGVQSA